MKRSRERGKPARGRRHRWTAILVTLLLTVGPLTVQAGAQSGAGDGERGEPLLAANTRDLGHSVAVHGTTAIVGDPDAGIGCMGSGDQGCGAAIVFTREGLTWTQEARLEAPDQDDEGDFGAGVALDGDTVLVGDPNGGPFDTGMVYTYTRSAGFWERTSSMTPSGLGGINDEFGASVATDGETAIVGAPRAGGVDEGAAYLFSNDGDSWSQQAEVTGDDSVSYFGVSVAVDGDKAIVGAPDEGFSDDGQAILFHRDGSGWDMQKRLFGTGGSGFSDGEYGTSVDLQADRAIVGDSVNEDGGSAAVWAWNGSAWNWETELTAPDTTRFGSGVALGPTQAVVGAPLVGDGETAGFVFDRADGDWTRQAHLIDPEGGDLGASAALADGTAVLGGPHAGPEANGRAVAYQLGCIEAGPVSGPVDDEVEPRAGQIDPVLGEAVDSVNCRFVVPLEDKLGN